MFTIKKKPLTPNIIWDGRAGKPLCNFGHKGTITTNDRDLAEKLAAMGHEVTGEAEAPAQPEQEPEKPGDGAENAQPEETAAPEPEKEPQAQAEQPGETAEAPAQQAAAPTTKGRRNRK